MPQPTRNAVHINRPLTNVMIAYLQSQAEFVASQVFKTIFVDKISDSYFIFPKGQWFRTDAQQRGDCEESVGSGFDISLDEFRCKQYSLHKKLSYQILGNQDMPLNLEMSSSEFVTRHLIMRKELDWAAKYFSTGIWTGSSTGTDIVPGTKWDQSTTATPINDIQDEMLAMRNNTGFIPNVLVLPMDVWLALYHCDQILDRMAITSVRVPTTELLATLLGLDKVIIANAVHNSANEGATPVLGGVYSDQALLCYSPKNQAIMQPAAGYTFVNRNMYPGANEGVAMIRFERPEEQCIKLEGSMNYDQKLVASDMGVFFNTVLT